MPLATTIAARLQVTHWVISLLTTVLIAVGAWFLSGIQTKSDQLVERAGTGAARIGVLEQRATEADRRFSEILVELRSINATLRTMRMR